MSLYEFLTTAEIKTLFAEEITSAGGTVTDTYDDGSLLFTRSILPQVREVRTADRMQGGVALRSSARGVWVHPYVFRLVCRNGAIMAHAIQTRQIEAQEFALPEEAAGAIRAAIQSCSAEDVFTSAVNEIRTTRETEVDFALNLLPFMSVLRSNVGRHILREIMERFVREGDESRFGLMNAVTSVARDTPEPNLRWRLEELGGGIAVGRVPDLQPGGTAAEMAMIG